MNQLFRPVVLLYLSLLLTAFAAALTVNAKDDEVHEVRIAVSDLLAETIAEPLRNLTKERSIDLSIESMGSLPAIDYLRSGKIDLAIIAAPETLKLPEGYFETCPFAFDATLIAVNATNPIAEISLPSLRAIFGVNNDLNIDVWGDLSISSSSWASRPIKPLVGQNEKTISLELFKFIVLGSEKMKVTVAEVKDSEIEDLLVSDTASIGILPDLTKNEKVKVLMVSVDSDSPAFGPTNDNVYYGDYPIYLPFQIVYDESDIAELKETLRVLLSNELADVLLANNLYVTPVTVRRKLMLDLNVSE